MEGDMHASETSRIPVTVLNPAEGLYETLKTSRGFPVTVTGKVGVHYSYSLTVQVPSAYADEIAVGDERDDIVYKNTASVSGEAIDIQPQRPSHGFVHLALVGEAFATALDMSSKLSPFATIPLYMSSEASDDIKTGDTVTATGTLRDWVWGERAGPLMFAHSIELEKMGS
jgi:hypothetical protein